MKKYLVGIQIIEVWHVEVTAANEDAARDAAYDLRVESIRKHGDFQDVETDHATVICESELED